MSVASYAADSSAAHVVESAPDARPPVCVCQGKKAPEPRKHTVAKWFANASAIGGGAVMAAFPAVCLSPLSYVPFFVSHVVWSVFAWKIREKELFYLNLGALGLDTWAILVRVL